MFAKIAFAKMYKNQAKFSEKSRENISKNFRKNKYMCTFIQVVHKEGKQSIFRTNRKFCVKNYFQDILFLADFSSTNFVKICVGFLVCAKTGVLLIVAKFPG